MSSISSKTKHGNLDNMGDKTPLEFMCVSTENIDPQSCVDSHLDNIIPQSVFLLSNIKILRTVNSGPNRVLNLCKVQRMINEFLNSCDQYKTGQLELKETKFVRFASTLCLECKKCSEVDVVEKNHGRYMLIKIQHAKHQLERAKFVRKLVQRKRRRKKKTQINE